MEMELAAARHEGFVGKYNSETAQTNSSKRLLAVVGIMTDFSRKNNRDAIRKSWLPTGKALLHGFPPAHLGICCDVLLYITRL